MEFVMKQRQQKKPAVLPEQNNRRKDWEKADVIDRGIEMEIDRGHFAAVRFLEEHDIRPDIIERVLRQRLDRRSRTWDMM